MPDEVNEHIQAMVDLEGWNEKNPDLLLSMIHPDMVWPWPDRVGVCFGAIRSRSVAEQLTESL